MKIDDVGSVPLPEGISFHELDSSLKNENFSQKILDLFDDMTRMKIDCGVEVPCYPQMRPMIEQFTSLFNDDEKCEEPYLVKEGVKLPEMMVMEKTDHKCKKACLSGPFELSLAEFNEARGNIMKKIGESFRRIFHGENLEVISIDEPSLGIRPPYDLNTEDLIDAWNIICEVDAFVEIHLHSVYFQEAVYRSNIDAIDFPTAGNNRNLNLIEKDILEEHDTKVRVGISRTDISKEKEITSLEEVVENLEKAEKVLSDRIEFCGPDCGLRNLNSMNLVEKILRNTSSGVNAYRKS